MGLLPFLPGTVLALVALVLLLLPPSRSMGWHGYRTRRSMRSEEAWEDANRFSAWALLIAGLLSMNLALTCRVLAVDPARALVIVLVGVLLLIGVLILLTERRSRNRVEDGDGPGT